MYNKKKIKIIKDMYIVARQFKNVIECKEFIPTSKNNLRSKTFPFIVNKAFACEIYLKLILKAQKDKEEKDEHNLNNLAKEIAIDIEFKKYLLLNRLQLSDQEFEEYLNNISNAFIIWRYIYEKKNIKIMIGFLNSFCNFLDEYCKKLIKDNCNIDIDKEIICI